MNTTQPTHTFCNVYKVAVKGIGLLHDIKTQNYTQN